MAYLSDLRVNIGGSSYWPALSGMTYDPGERYVNVDNPGRSARVTLDISAAFPDALKKDVVVSFNAMFGRIRLVGGGFRVVNEPETMVRDRHGYWVRPGAISVILEGPAADLTASGANC